MSNMFFDGEHEPQTVQDQIDDAGGGGNHTIAFTIPGAVEKKMYNPGWRAPTTCRVTMVYGSLGAHDSSTHPGNDGSAVYPFMAKLKIYEVNESTQTLTFTGSQLRIEFGQYGHYTSGLYEDGTVSRVTADGFLINAGEAVKVEITSGYGAVGDNFGSDLVISLSLKDE